jgi:hypothetical protein
MNGVALQISRTDTSIFNVDLVNTSGITLDLTGATVYFIVKQHYGDLDSQAIINKNSGGTGVVIIGSPLNGMVQITVLPSDTVGLSAGQNNLIYNVRVKDAGSNVSTPISGILQVLPVLNQSTLQRPIFIR